MIIFDTNAVNLLPLIGPRAEIIRKLRESGHHRVAVPWMVLEEMAAHQAVYYPAKYKSAVDGLRKLQDALPWELKSSLEALDLERLLNHWRVAYREIFEVIDTSGEVALRALAREAMALPPAKRDKERSEGARDVAIWFSILEFLEENPEEHVYFVTNNTHDFGDGTAYAYPMDEDVRNVESRLTRLTDFDQVVSRFTKEVSGRDAESAAAELLRSGPIQSRLIQAAVEILRSPTGFVGMGASDGAMQWRSWITSPEAELHSVTDVVGHEIEGDTWYTGNARWLLYGVASDGNDTRSIACVWEVKLLFSASEEGQTPTLLTLEDPSLPDMADEWTVKTLARLKERSADVARRTLANLSVPPVAAGGYLGQRMADSIAKLDLAGQLPSVTLGQRMADSIAKLDLAGQLPSVTLGQRMADSIAKLDLAGQLPSVTLGQQMADSIAKLDLAGQLPSVTLGEQLIASMPESEVTDLVKGADSSLDDETESDEEESGGED